MNILRAISGLTCRLVIRSRLFACLFFLLLLGVVGLLLTIKGDGTPAGQVYVLLRYALAYIQGLLSVATLWTACALTAGEIEDRTLQMTLVRAVHRWQIWLGKWMGLLVVNAALLLWGSALIFGLVQWTLRDNLECEQLLAVRREAVRLGEEAASLRVVAPGERTEWRFRVLGRSVSTAAPTLEYVWQSSDPERLKLTEGRWEFRAEGGMPISVTVTNFTGRRGWVRAPVGMTAGASEMTVAFENNNRRHPVTFVFTPENQPVLLMPAGTLTGNLGRAIFVLWARLAFLAALGITVGCLLSTPVAAFVSFSCVVVLAFSGYIRSVVATGVFYVPHEGGTPEMGPLDAGIHALFRAVEWVIRPLTGVDPLTLLAEGRQIAGAAVVSAVFWQAAVYAAVLWLAGSWLFSRREIGAVA